MFFLIVSPEDEQGIHLKFLATVSNLLQSEENRSRIREFSSAQDAMAFFTMVDEAEAAE
jgi:mannitol/fructose-specific phosphotransferase system IIA component (Ntr-type)